MTGDRRRYLEPGAERPEDQRCPDGHTGYGSEQLAENAAYLHTLAHPGCLHIVAFVHGDHWHIGHDDRDAGDVCKAEDARMGRVTRARLERARRDGRADRRQRRA